MRSAADESDSSQYSIGGGSEFNDRLREMPPSAKLVIHVLRRSSGMTQSELVEETMLPRRTVQHALRKLETASLVNSRSSVRDARKQVYHVRCHPSDS